MQLKRLIDDDEAVSPVIGVILMVAITVILAAVIATFVLGLGEKISATGPTSGFDFEYTEGSPDTLKITHVNGDTIKAGNLKVVGAQEEGAWSDLPSAPYGPESTINAGDSVTVEVKSDDTVRVIWSSDGGDQSRTLERWDGPDA